MNERLNDEQNAELDAWFHANGYNSEDDWANDSDYIYGDEGWMDENGNLHPDIRITAYWAMEASKEAGDRLEETIKENEAIEGQIRAELDEAERNRDLGFGDKLSNAEVMQFTLMREAGEGWRRHGVALCIRRFDQYQAAIRRHSEEFVVWHAYRDERGDWFAESGHYTFDFFAAVEVYKQRGGK